eukprot:scaffold27937_cov112-Isochrysis_galbana.AAC.1
MGPDSRIASLRPWYNPRGPQPKPSRTSDSPDAAQVDQRKVPGSSTGLQRCRPKRTRPPAASPRRVWSCCGTCPVAVGRVAASAHDV